MLVSFRCWSVLRSYPGVSWRSGRYFVLQSDCQNWAHSSACISACPDCAWQALHAAIPALTQCRQQGDKYWGRLASSCMHANEPFHTRVCRPVLSSHVLHWIAAHVAAVQHRAQIHQCSRWTRRAHPVGVGYTITVQTNCSTEERNDGFVRNRLHGRFLLFQACAVKLRSFFLVAWFLRAPREKHSCCRSESIGTSSPSHVPSAGRGLRCLSAHGIRSDITVMLAPAARLLAVYRSWWGAFRLPIRDPIISFTFSKGRQLRLPRSWHLP